MKRTINEKGITLVALVITVVVLLILAGVAISTINETGIIAKSNDAAAKFNASQADESENLIGYEDLIDKYAGDSNTPTTTVITFYIDGVKFKAESANGKFLFTTDNYGGDTIFTAIENGGGIIGKNYPGAAVEYIKDGVAYLLYDGNSPVYCDSSVKSGKNYTIKILS